MKGLVEHSSLNFSCMRLIKSIPAIALACVMGCLMVRCSLEEVASMNMRIESVDSDGGQVRITATGTIFTIDSAAQTIYIKQRIPEERDVAIIRVSEEMAETLSAVVTDLGNDIVFGAASET